MGVEAGPDGRTRCWWCLGAPELLDYPSVFPAPDASAPELRALVDQLIELEASAAVSFAEMLV